MKTYVVGEAMVSGQYPDDERTRTSAVEYVESGSRLGTQYVESVVANLRRNRLPLVGANIGIECTHCPTLWNSHAVL